jgi:hypothetical protein
MSAIRLSLSLAIMLARLAEHVSPPLPSEGLPPRAEVLIEHVARPAARW